MSASAALEAKGISYRVHDRLLVDTVDLGLRAGELLVLVGPNGAGKSTLLRLLTGEIKPTQGSVLYNDLPIHDQPAWRLALQRAVLPQSSRMIFPLKVVEVARLGIEGLGRRLPGGTMREIVGAALQAADITHLAQRSYPTLSGGEQQRTQFARILCQLQAGRLLQSSAAGKAAPSILLLDEPVSSLDLRHQIALLDSARALAREGVAVLAVLHDLNLACAYADRLLVLANGSVAACGNPHEVVNNDLLESVFRIALPVRTLPPEHIPFILPQALTCL